MTKKQEWKAEVSECPDSVLEAAAGATCRGKKKKKIKEREREKKEGSEESSSRKNGLVSLENGKQEETVMLSNLKIILSFKMIFNSK